MLLHIGAFGATMIDELIKLYSSKGVEFMPMSTALQSPVYKNDPDIAFTGGAELTYQLLKKNGISSRDPLLQRDAEFPAKELDRLCR